MAATPPFGISGETPIPTPIPIAARWRHATAAHWVETAINLAYAYRMDGTLLFEGIFEGDLVYTSPSVSRPHLRHVVRMNVDTPRLICDCAHGERHAPCPHVGAAILLLRQIERSALPENLRSQMQYENWANSAAG